MSPDSREYPNHLLDRAGRLIADGFPEVALVLTQTACELCCEQTVEALLVRHGPSWLQGCLRDLLPSFNIANTRTHEFYTALGGEHIQDQAFWCDYMSLVKKRNRVVHAADTLTGEEAQAFLEVAGRLVGHLQATIVEPQPA